MTPDDCGDAGDAHNKSSSSHSNGDQHFKPRSPPKFRTALSYLLEDTEFDSRHGKQITFLL
jgi:hypothetical protein